MNKQIYETKETKEYRVEKITPLCIENAQSALSSAESSSLITAPEGGVLNERRCKGTIYNLTPNYGVDSMMMEIPKGSSIIVERRNVNEFHPDMFSAILLSSSPKFRIVAISFNDVSVTEINFEG